MNACSANVLTHSPERCTRCDKRATDRGARNERERDYPHLVRARREVAHVAARVDSALEPLIAGVLQKVVTVVWVAVREFVMDEQQHYDKDNKHHHTPRRHARLHRVRREIRTLFYQ